MRLRSGDLRTILPAACSLLAPGQIPLRENRRFWIILQKGAPKPSTCSFFKEMAGSLCKARLSVRLAIYSTSHSSLTFFFTVNRQGKTIWRKPSFSRSGRHQVKYMQQNTKEMGLSQSREKDKGLNLQRARLSHFWNKYRMQPHEGGSEQIRMGA